MKLSSLPLEEYRLGYYLDNSQFWLEYAPGYSYMNENGFYFWGNFIEVEKIHIHLKYDDQLSELYSFDPIKKHITAKYPIGTEDELLKWQKTRNTYTVNILKFEMKRYTKSKQKLNDSEKKYVLDLRKHTEWILEWFYFFNYSTPIIVPSIKIIKALIKSKIENYNYSPKPDEKYLKYRDLYKIEKSKLFIEKAIVLLKHNNQITFDEFTKVTHIPILFFPAVKREFKKVGIILNIPKGNEIITIESV